MSAALFDGSVAPEDRYDLVCDYLYDTDTVDIPVVLRLLRDDDELIRCEALDCIIDSREVELFADVFKQMADDEGDWLPRGRVLAGLAILARNGGAPLQIVNDVRFSMWVNLSEYIATRNVLTLAMLLSRASHEVEGVKSLLRGLLVLFDDLIDAGDLRAAEAIVRSLAQPETASEG